MGQSLKAMYGIVLQKRKISQTFSIRLLAIRVKIAHYVDVVTSSHLLWSDQRKGMLPKNSDNCKMAKRHVNITHLRYFNNT